jgi:hypothetical protein
MNIPLYTIAENPATLSPYMKESKHGEWVRYKDYFEMSEYADRLVAHKDMVCLPADLKNLREANAAFAIENEILKEQIRLLTKPI